MPHIGCGLAGGNWDQIEPIINDTPVADGIFVTVYDSPGSGGRTAYFALRASSFAKASSFALRATADISEDG